MKTRVLSLSVLFVLLLVFGSLGCGNDGKSGNSDSSGENRGGSVPDKSAGLGNTSFGVAQSVQFRIVLPSYSPSVEPTSPAQLTGIKPSRASGTPCVTFRLTLVNLAVATQPPIFLSKTVLVDASGTAMASFSSVPAITCVGDVHIEGGAIGSYSDFHGADDLDADLVNTVRISPKGSKTLLDITAKVIESLIFSSEVLGKIGSSQAQEVTGAVEKLDLNSSTVIEDAVAILASGRPTASEALSGISLNPEMESVITNEVYELTNITVTASYNNSSKKVVKDVIWSGKGVSGTTFTASTSTGSVPLTCMYTECGITKTADVSMMVNAIKPGPKTVITLPGGMKMNFVEIPDGNFQMGNATGDSDEQSVHHVTIQKAFLMGTCEVTQEQYQSVMKVNPSYFVPTQTAYSSGYSNTASQPVEHVSWYDAVRFCNALSNDQHLTPCYKNQSNITSIDDRDNVTCDWSATGYRLPTEAEWEYACRAGQTTVYFWGDDAEEITMKKYAWYRRNAYDYYWTEPHAEKGGTQPVGMKLPNKFGLYDMSGNVWEWCWDRFGSYTSDAASDPRGSESGWSHVYRGGHWISDRNHCRSTNRSGGLPSFHWFCVGFRIVRMP
ncbi:MAG: formylglycine-generating enzyme family protein [Candidatus Ozemobacteraceae bacterium]